VKLGLLGGTFDPIHRGHLNAATLACETLSLDRVLLAPSRVPPHRGEPRASVYDRFAMVALATAHDQRLVPSDVEIQRPGVSYTVDTLETLRAASPDSQFVLIVGSDTFSEMATWREPDRLFAMCEVAVVTRPGMDGARGDDPRVHRVPGSGLSINQKQLVAMADAVLTTLRAQGLRPDSVEGYPRQEWMLLDFDSFVVHLFTPGTRSFYGLERLWGEAARMEIDG
jgi:nicotinate (nicotinamide) nucleotide adenylyltransferase